MFVARDALNNRQPITGGIGLGFNARKGDPHFGKWYVFFGTGQYLVSADVSDKSVQTWYGLIDSGPAIADRSDLKQRTIIAETTMSGTAVRAFSLASAGDMIGKRGWYLDFVPPSGADGERMITEPEMQGSVLLATSIIPSTNICTPGGDGFLNAIDPFSGGSLASPFFDVDGDKKFNSSDIITVAGKSIPVGSISPNNNLPSRAIVMGDGAFLSGTGGKAVKQGVQPTIRTGRISWREITRQN